MFDVSIQIRKDMRLAKIRQMRAWARDGFPDTDRKVQFVIRPGQGLGLKWVPRKEVRLRAAAYHVSRHT